MKPQPVADAADRTGTFDAFFRRYNANAARMMSPENVVSVTVPALQHLPPSTNPRVLAAAFVAAAIKAGASKGNGRTGIFEVQTDDGVFFRGGKPLCRPDGSGFPDVTYRTWAELDAEDAADNPPAAAPAAAPPPALDAQGTLRAGYQDVVALDGHVLVQWLAAAHAWARAALFEGKILGALVLITPPSSTRALADYAAKDPHGVRSLIRIGPSVANRGCLRYLGDVLLHEMIHAACSEIDDDREPGYRGHGPIFTARCNAIGEQLGLPPVYVKGRVPAADAAAVAATMATLGGEGTEPPDSARWPLCVRPRDYYATPEGAKPLNHGKVAKPAAEPEPEPAEPAAEPDDDRQCREDVAKLLQLIGECVVAGDMDAACKFARVLRDDDA